MGSTNGALLPYPELTETADGPAALSGLANSVEDYFYDRILPSGVTRWPSYHWGSGTAFPTTGGVGGPRVGDTFVHTGLGNCLMRWNGTAWRQTEIPEMTATALTAMATNYASALYNGFQVQETDTNLLRRWDGTYWEIARYFGPVNALPMWSAVQTGASIPSSATAGAVRPATTKTAGVGNSLFSYDQATGILTCNFKGRVTTNAMASSDSAVNRASQFYLTSSNPAGAYLGTAEDQRSNPGTLNYNLSGGMRQSVEFTNLHVQPGYQLRLFIASVTSTAVAQAFDFYWNVFLVP